LRSTVTLIGSTLFPTLAPRARKLEQTAPLPRPARFLSWFSPFTTRERAQLLSAPANGTNRSEQTFQRLFEGAKPLSETAQLQWIDLVTFLRDDLLVKADKMSIRHSLEVRVPFLQADVVTAAFAYPDRAKVTALETKKVLRSLLRDYLPTEIVDRKK